MAGRTQTFVFIEYKTATAIPSVAIWIDHMTPSQSALQAIIVLSSFKERSQYMENFILLGGTFRRSHEAELLDFHCRHNDTARERKRKRVEHESRL